MTDETRAVPTSADIEAIRQRADAATDGPWGADGLTDRFEWVVIEETNCTQVAMTGRDARHAADAEFIAHARTDVPALLAVLDGERRHRADLERQLEEAQDRGNHAVRMWVQEVKRRAARGDVDDDDDG